MSFWAIGAAVVAVVGETVNMVEQSRISKQQASNATKVAQYNADVDVANAQQLSMNANANIAKQRQQDQSYLSAQRAAYAASGVLSGTGSPMTLQATTAGRMEQDIQQNWASVQEKESQLYGSAAEGIVEGQEESDVYHLQSTAAIFQGIGQIANTVGGAASKYSSYKEGQNTDGG